ncbi:hypothetical protein BSS2_I2038 [Brucella suis bv. 1 str. S2]|uniref:Uncharacterized protein n=4 Tax=Brucella TaxID=234 RepID=Q2YQX1_BRUA2|nr:hypothetical protein BR2104 [Brucella suis 1330]AAX75378.1 hypothetical protein BruAb1_2079 [Brucella abortus bv. 1 str. 9-941]ACU49064.1 hypothetical protein BMI_I2126 [Brucella microti CCM 4915]AEK55383.1 hypothetical protein BPI_I2162 [Brucella pinnipedialis B2/94]AEU07081.1 hypothetical protein BSVBI22_A2100 [Brucella suis VBI22]AHN47685.1 hypothetical protein BSS2_I2038 [Brucella suis bv. 1 str. S2]EFM57912.1 Hypothetical protein BIBO1_0174 [Brucella inopinata BO1]EFM58566.1 Hypothet
MAADAPHDIANKERIEHFRAKSVKRFALENATKQIVRAVPAILLK